MRRLILMLIVVCSIGALSHAQAKQTSKKTDTKQDQAKCNPCCCCPTTQTITPPVTANSTKTAQDYSAKHASKGERFIRWLIDVKSTDVLMVALTLAYVTVTTCLLIAVRRQGETAISGERAWLFENDVPQYWKQASGSMGCHVEYRNFGKSPAWITSVAGSFQWIESESQLSRRPIYAHINLDDFAPVPAGDNRNFLVSNQIGNPPRDDKSRLAVFVSISYYDRFTVNGKPRRLKYCFISTDKSLRRWNIKAGPRGYNEYT